MMQLQQFEYCSPLATILLVFDQQGTLCALDFADCESRMKQLLRRYYGDYCLERGPAPSDLVAALDAYFSGDLDALNGIRIKTIGTAFQLEVWQSVRAIRPGTTKSYGQIALELRRAGASRAVGAANGANPIAIVVPCHRVIGANGTLTGYAGSIPRKQWLLEHEAIWSAVV